MLARTTMLPTDRAARFGAVPRRKMRTALPRFRGSAVCCGLIAPPRRGLYRRSRWEST